VREAGKTIDDSSLLPETCTGTYIYVLNKIDLMDHYSQTVNGAIAVSALKGTGLDQLREALLDTVRPDNDSAFDSSLPRITRARQKALIEHASANLGKIDTALSSEYIAADIDEACRNLAEITGTISNEEVLDSIFSKFCIGK
jgi:tRNA modification GTPase